MSTLSLFKSFPPLDLNGKRHSVLEMALINPQIDAHSFLKILNKINKINDDLLDNLSNKLIFPTEENDNINYIDNVKNKILKLSQEFNLTLTNDALIYLINKSKTFEYAISQCLQNPEIINYRVSKIVRGQEELVTQLAAHFYQWQLFWSKRLKSKPKSIPMLIGGTGTGKTFSINTFADVLNTGLITIDASKLVTEGYVGPQITTEIIMNYNKLPDDRKNKVIVFIDEIDKLSTNYVENSDIKGNNVLFELLTILESDKICGRENYLRDGDRKCIDTTNFSYIFAGAFTELKKNQPLSVNTIGFSNHIPCPTSSDTDSNTTPTLHDIINYGMPPEIIGRIGWLLPLKQMSREIYRDILLCSPSSPLNYYKELYEIHGVDFHISDDNINDIISSAMDKKLGVRGLIHSLSDFFSSKLNALFSQGIL